MSDFERSVSHSGELRVDTRGLSRVLTGHAIVFNRMSEVLGGPGGFFREMIAPSAIDRTLRDGTDLRALVDHDSGKPLGRMRAGTLRVEKDAQGLRVEIDPPQNSVGQDIVVSVQRGDVTGMSFGFMAMGEDATWWDFKTDPPMRTVRDMLVREVSIVTFPAYPDTSVASRSLKLYQPRRPTLAQMAQEWQRKRELWATRRP